MRRHLASITDVAERHLCTGCGVCAYVQPDDVRLVDDVEVGRRPITTPGSDTTRALAACPGVGLDGPARAPRGALPELFDAWGPVLEVWEGWAADPEIRFAGSSGGAATALALDGIEAGELGGVLHIAARPDAPLLNQTVYSTSREELLAATGSRYAPASPCDGLHHVRDADRPSAFIGKPCDVAATAKARRSDPALDSRLALTIAIFCAGTPSLAGTLALLDELGVDDPAAVESIRYRGNGWPGDAVVTVRTASGEARTARTTYQASWGGVLQRHRQWRCHVCVDHTGEFADISVGDPWYRPVGEGEPGRSLILVRSEAGRAALRRALERGTVIAEPAGPQHLVESQPNLLKTRGAVWARVATTRALGVAAPRYRNLATFPSWRRELGPIDKIRSVTGTVRRTRRRRLHRRRPVVALPADALIRAGAAPSSRSRQLAARYVVVTPVRDEIAHLAALYDAISAQSLRPVQWILVDDGSTDGSTELIEGWARRDPWITIVRRADRGHRAAGSGVMQAVQAGIDAISAPDWEFLVKLDADLELPDDYFERCLARFEADPRLGMGGGLVVDRGADGREALEQRHPDFHVRGATKIYRRACWDTIGPLPQAAGWDTIDELRACHGGWRTATFADIVAVQGRTTGQRAGTWRDWTKNGRAAHAAGYHPAFVAARAVRNALQRPFGVKGVALAWGWAGCVLARRARLVDDELARYVRGQQLRRLVGLPSIWR